MGHEQHRRPRFLADLPDHGCHPLLVAQIQAVQWFVQGQDARDGRQVPDEVAQASVQVAPPPPPQVMGEVTTPPAVLPRTL